MSDERQTVCFPINEHKWILLFEKLVGSKVIVHATKIKFLHQGKRWPNENDHRGQEVEADTSVMVRPKTYDIRDFPKQD